MYAIVGSASGCTYDMCHLTTLYYTLITPELACISMVISSGSHAIMMYVTVTWPWLLQTLRRRTYWQVVAMYSVGGRRIICTTAIWVYAPHIQFTHVLISSLSELMPTKCTFTNTTYQRVLLHICLIYLECFSYGTEWTDLDIHYTPWVCMWMYAHSCSHSITSGWW